MELFDDRLLGPEENPEEHVIQLHQNTEKTDEHYEMWQIALGEYDFEEENPEKTDPSDLIG